MNLRRNVSRLLLAAALAVLPAGLRAESALERCIDATCRITASDGGRGTGCVFEISNDTVFVLTAAHVVGRGEAVACEFWSEGRQSLPIPGRVTARAEAEAFDAAIITIDAARFGGRLPTAIPIAPADFALPQGAPILSVGCAGGSWSTGWKGHVLSCRDGEVRFAPTPANGRSGSAIFDAEGRWIVALLRARTADNAEGIATSVQNLYRAFGGDAPQKATPRDLRPVQCPGGVCPAPTPYVLPYRYQQQFRTAPSQPSPSVPQSPYPMLPAPGGSTTPDLSGTNGRLDRIAALLEELRASRTAKPETAPVPDPTPKADTAGSSAAANATAGKAQEVFDLLIGDPNTLVDRIAARRAKISAQLGLSAGELDIAKAYARDYASEKLSDGSLGLSLGKLIAGAIGLSGPLALAIGGGMWLVSRRLGASLKTGEPLVASSLLQTVTAKIDELKSTVIGQQPAPVQPTPQPAPQAPAQAPAA